MFPAEGEGAPPVPDEWNRTVLDAMHCGPDDRFQTEPLLPGKYTILAEAVYIDRDYEGTNGVFSGSPLWARFPQLVGQAKVTVPENGRPSQVTVELRPREPLPVQGQDSDRKAAQGAQPRAGQPRRSSGGEPHPTPGRRSSARTAIDVHIMAGENVIAPRSLDGWPTGRQRSWSCPSAS